MSKTYVGIDNGVSGSIGIIGSQVSFLKTPTKKEQSYTKTKQNISRIDVVKLEDLFLELNTHGDIFVVMERPMVNPTRFKASMSAMRALEATLCTLESCRIPFQYCDSKEWQKVLLPKDIKGADLLKKASLDVGTRLFPQFAELFKKQKDADGMLIAEWARRSQL